MSSIQSGCLKKCFSFCKQIRLKYLMLLEFFIMSFVSVILCFTCFFRSIFIHKCFVDPFIYFFQDFLIFTCVLQMSYFSKESTLPLKVLLTFLVYFFRETISKDKFVVVHCHCLTILLAALWNAVVFHSTTANGFSLTHLMLLTQ